MSLTQRKVLHVDMDAFYAAVAQRDDPLLQGRPVVVAWRGPRSVVCAASYEARALGVHSAMPALRAARLCPDAVFVPPDFARYQSISQHIRAIFARHTDLIEPLSLDEAYLDVTAPKSTLGSATAIAKAIRLAIREETGLTASAGVAPNKFLAKIASDWRKPDGLFVIRPHHVLAFLEPLTVGKLPGVGKMMQTKLAECGIKTVGQLRTRTAAELEQRFGRWGIRLHELSLGIDQHPVQPQRTVKQVSSEDTFAEDLPLAALEPHIRRLAAKTWLNQARMGGRIAHTVVLKLKTAHFCTLTRSLTSTRPPNSAEELAEIAWALRERIALPESTRYRLAGVGLSGFSDADEPPQLQGELFD